MHRLIHTSLLIGALLMSSGCTQPAASSSSGKSDDSAIVLLNVTSDGVDDAQSVDMAMKLAGFALDEGRQVAMFFNVKGVRVPTQSSNLKYAENDPVADQLAKLIERGADVHVCPICMQALGVEQSQLVDGAKVTTRPTLFANIGPDTAVFTY